MIAVDDWGADMFGLSIIVACASIAPPRFVFRLSDLVLSGPHRPDRKYEDFYRVGDPHSWNPGEAPARSFQSRHCHLFQLFYQVQIRLTSRHLLKEPWAGPDDIDNQRDIIGHLYRNNLRIIENR
jgi:hypothetical protein